MINDTPDDNCIFCGDKVGLVDDDHAMCKGCNQPVCCYKGVITCDGGKWEDELGGRSWEEELERRSWEEGRGD